MIFSIVLIVVLTLSAVIYSRYADIYKVPAGSLREMHLPDVAIVDVRDWQDSARNPIEGAVTIPAAYLKRYSAEIPCKKIFLVSSDSNGKNLGIRFLHKKGFKVAGYIITNE